MMLALLLVLLGLTLLLRLLSGIGLFGDPAPVA